jgi:enoyl-CoA hydratase/carnithine racemase
MFTAKPWLAGTTPGRPLRPAHPRGGRNKEDSPIEFDTLLYQETDGVAVVTLNRPEVHNAFNEAMQRELRQLWRSLRSNDNVRAIVVTGSGEKAFCTGIDRSDVPTTEGDYFFDPLTYEDPGQIISPRAQGLWKPIIGAVNGMACGGAFYLLGQVDFIVAAEHATFFDPHVTYGMPAVFEPALMADKMPFGEVMRMTLMGNRERISAATAERIGLVTQVVPSSELAAVTLELARTIASYPAAAVQASLRAVWASREVPPGQMLELGNFFLNMATSVETLASSQQVFQNRKPEPPTIR